jgi:hypothetical protein
MADYQPGDICKFTTPEQEARHPFAVLGKCDNDNYLGCMITHADPKIWVDNMPMSPSYFVKLDENGIAHEVFYSIENGIGSHFVKVGLEKYTGLDVYRAGRLSDEGLRELTKIVKETAPELWEVYSIYSKAQKEHNIRLAKSRARKLRNSK